MHRVVPVDQPPLPWLADDPEGAEAFGTRDRAGGVRIVRFGDSWAGPVPDDRPDPGPWAAQLAIAVFEALRGVRPVAQLNRWLSPATLSQLTVLVSRRWSRRGSRTPPVLQAVHLQRSGPAAVEAVAVFRDGDRAVTCAFRLEALADRWLCTALETRPMLTRRA